MKNLIEKHPFLIICILFLISFAFRFYCADFYKTIYVYPDEVRYYQLAENIARGAGFLIYNLPTEFQKILYPLFLAPAFFFENRETQQHAIAFINAFWICLSIFPIYLIAKKLLKKNILFICFFSLFLPELAIASTLMSEVVFLPFSLFLFYGYLLLILKENEKLPFLILLGLGSYLLYLTKEVGVLFPVAFLIYGFILYFVEKNILLFKKHLQNSAVIWGVFLLCFFIFKFTCFYNLGNFYFSQADFQSAFETLGASTPFFFFYAGFYFLLHILMAALFFPVILSLAYFKKLSAPNQKALFFLGILLLLSTFAISYSVFIREGDFLNPRPLTRYVIYAPILFFIFYLNLCENKLPTFSKKQILFCGAAIFAILFFYQLSQFRAQAHSPTLFLFKENILWSVHNFYIFKIFFAALALFLLFKPNKKIIFGFAFLFYCSCQYFLISDIFEKYGVNKEQKAELQKIEDFILKNPNKTFLIVEEELYLSDNISLADSFFYHPNVINSFAQNIIQNKNKIVADFQIPQIVRVNFIPKFYFKETIHYFIVPTKIHYFENFKEIGKIQNIHGAKKVFEGNHFLIFQNQNPTIIPNFEFVAF